MSTRGLFNLRTQVVPLVSLLLLAAAVHAAPFDERIRAPRALAPADLKQRAADYFAAYARLSAATGGYAPAAQLRDRRLYEQWARLNWQLHRTLEEKRPVGDLSEFGLAQQEDGSYVANLREFPQWVPLDSLLIVLRSPQSFEGDAVQLKARGFRDQDVEALRNYIATRDYEAAAFEANKPLIESFAKRVQARARANLPIDREQVMAYVYQRTRNHEEARRLWAVGLLDCLDEQRQRILQSYFGEMENSHALGPAAVPLDELIRQTVDPLISGAYVEALRQKELEVQR